MARTVNFTRHEIETKSILVVDDFADMRNMLKGMLQVISVSDIDAAATGEDAIAAMSEKRYDIVLCDYNLGRGKNGQQVLEEARHRDLIGVGSIFVMVTAENTREMVMGAVEYEPDSYLTKPFTKDLLKSRLERLIARKKNLEAVDAAVRRRAFEEAVTLLDAKTAEKPSNLGELTKLKAELCYRAGNYDRAVEIYEGVLAVRDMPWAKLGLGKTCYQLGRFQEAKELFEDLIAQNERIAAAYDWLAKALEALDQPQVAQEVLERAVVVSPKAILRQRALGELALKNGDSKCAEKALLQAVRMGRFSVYKHPKLHANLARAKVGNGAAKEGLKVLKDMEKEFEGVGEAKLYSVMVEGVIQNELGEDDNAESCLQQAFALYEQMGGEADAGLTLELARSCGQLGQQERAKELLKQVVRNNHAEDEFLREVGSVFKELEQDADSESFISDIRRELVKLNNRGVELAKAGQLDEAVVLFEEAVEGMPGNKVVNLNAARAQLMFMQDKGIEKTRLGKVRRYLDQVNRLDPENPTLRRVQDMYKQLVTAAI